MTYFGKANFTLKFISKNEKVTYAFVFKNAEATSLRIVLYFITLIRNGKNMKENIFSVCFITQ